VSKTILVTGAAGFIGSHVTHAFLERGDRVVGVDNLNDFYAPERKRANLDELRQNGVGGKQFTFVEADLRNRGLADRLLSENTFDAIVHLAGMGGVRNSIEEPRLYFAVNLESTLDLLEAARRRPVENFVFASTSSVYGATERIPFVETDPCDRPLAPYAASKRAAEVLGFTYHHLHRLNFTALRFFTVYGPRNRPDMMAYKVADNLFFGREVALYNEGRVWRDWTYVDDIVSGVLAATDRPLGYEIFNLGRGEPVLLADFIRRLEELAGRKANFVPAPLPDTDILSTHADIGKARRLLDYQPRVSVGEGVARFWEWYRRRVLVAKRAA